MTFSSQLKPIASRVTAAALLAVATFGCSGGPKSDDGEAAARETLQTVASFSSIADETERSKALFVEAGRVIQHPRCLNCHPMDAHPRQGENLAMHQPPVVRGAAGFGATAMTCGTCHQAANVDHAGIPGDPAWHLAPSEMGWIGETLQGICEQIKDTELNGGRSLEELHEHMAHDSLVGWAWNPGEGREPAPGTQRSFGELIQAWIDTGAHCPDGEAGQFTGPEAEYTADCSSCHEKT